MTVAKTASLHESTVKNAQALAGAFQPSPPRRAEGPQRDSKDIKVDPLLWEWVQSQVKNLDLAWQQVQVIAPQTVIIWNSTDQAERMRRAQ